MPTTSSDHALLKRACAHHQVRKMAGMLLYCLKQAAKPISTDENNCHRRRIEEDEAFYKNWLFPRFEQFYRQQGWAVGDGLGVIEPAGGSLGPSKTTKKTKSRRPCSPFGRKPGPRVKRALKRLKFTRRRDQPPADKLRPQVGTAALDSRTDGNVSPLGR